jgi:ankyrin repeat protein
MRFSTMMSPDYDLAHNHCFPLRFACAKGHTEVVKYYIQEHPRMDFAVRANKPIREAARMGRLEIVRMLLAHPDVNPAARSNFAIRMAA